MTSSRMTCSTRTPAVADHLPLRHSSWRNRVFRSAYTLLTPARKSSLRRKFTPPRLSRVEAKGRVPSSAAARTPSARIAAGRHTAGRSSRGRPRHRADAFAGSQGAERRPEDAAPQARTS
jgi:hypothetical protein